MGDEEKYKESLAFQSEQASTNNWSQAKREIDLG